jgi:hypothetical protein
VGTWTELVIRPQQNWSFAPNRTGHSPPTELVIRLSTPSTLRETNSAMPAKSDEAREKKRKRDRENKAAKKAVFL